MKKPINPLKLSTREIDWIIGGVTYVERSLRMVAKRASAGYGLGPRGGWILVLIDHGQVVYPSDVKGYFNISYSVITDELARLTKAGLISYNSSSKDRRRVELAPTRVGAQVAARTRKAYRRVIAEQFSGYPREDVLKMSYMMRHFIPGQVADRWEKTRDGQSGTADGAPAMKQRARRNPAPT